MEEIIFGLLLLWVLRKRSSSKKYNQSDYKQLTQHSYVEVIFNKGKRGEYRLYNELINLDGDTKVLPNVYVPKIDGTMSEIDLLLIAKTGMYVFESKNYSGWIYGAERRKNWTQTFPNKEKHSFYNPIWQNWGHISALKEYMAIDKAYFHSIIVFGENATIKSEELMQTSVPVLKRHEVRRKLLDDFAVLPVILTPEDILWVYESLKPLTQVSKEVKTQHIASVSQKQTSK